MTCYKVTKIVMRESVIEILKIYHRKRLTAVLQVQVSLLGAHAAVKTYAYACSQGNTKSSSDSVIILPLLAKHADILGRYWIGILRDYTALRLHATTKLQVGSFVQNLTRLLVLLLNRITFKSWLLR